MRFRRHLHYRVGEEKLYHELDCISLIKTIRHLKIMTQLLFSKHQEFLIKFQRNNVIDSSSSGTSDEGNTNIVKYFRSNVDYDKEKVENKLKSNSNWYKQNQLTQMDLKIIRGVIKKRFSEDDDNNYKVDSENSFNHQSRFNFLNDQNYPYITSKTRARNSVKLLMNNMDKREENGKSPKFFSILSSDCQLNNSNENHNYKNFEDSESEEIKYKDSKDENSKLFTKFGR